MATATEAGVDNRLLAAAAGGDEQAFRLVVEPQRRALHLHCYRMLGSLDDADDALQDTLLRAWRSLPGFEPRAPLGAWLHAIATNVCLTALGRRTRAAAATDKAAAEAWAALGHLHPYPDRLLAELPSSAPGPEARYLQLEAVELAFVTAVQLLPPKQRAVLILRDVLGWSARETASALDDSVAAVNSALQRARAGVERARELGAPRHRPAGEEHDRELLRRFMEAWKAVDIEGIVGLLARDAVMTMPPEPMYVRGAEAIGEFFATVPAGGRLDEIRLVPSSANGQPALAAYVRGEDGRHRGYGIMVLALAAGTVAGIVGFVDPSLFERFGLPTVLEEE